MLLRVFFINAQGLESNGRTMGQFMYILNNVTNVCDYLLNSTRLLTKVYQNAKNIPAVQLYELFAAFILFSLIEETMTSHILQSFEGKV